MSSTLFMHFAFAMQIQKSIYIVKCILILPCINAWRSGEGKRNEERQLTKTSCTAFAHMPHPICKKPELLYHLGGGNPLSSIASNRSFTLRSSPTPPLLFSISKYTPICSSILPHRNKRCLSAFRSSHPISSFLKFFISERYLHPTQKNNKVF